MMLSPCHALPIARIGESSNAVRNLSVARGLHSRLELDEAMHCRAQSGHGDGRERDEPLECLLLRLVVRCPSGFIRVGDFAPLIPRDGMSLLEEVAPNARHASLWRLMAAKIG
jgi:hypothetical protein